MGKGKGRGVHIRTVKRPRVPLSVMFRFDTDAELRLQAKPYAALEKIKAKIGEHEDWDMIVFRLDVYQQLCVKHFEGDHHAAITLALAACVSIYDRYKRVGKFGCDDEEYIEIKNGLNVCDEVQKHTTRREQREMSKYIEDTVGVRRPSAPPDPP